MPIQHSTAASLILKNNGSTAGFVTLGWSGERDSVFTLQMQKNDTWVTLYEGRDTATTLTGLKNGEYSFRLKEQEGDWSEPLKVVIEHHPLWKALAFFAAGLFLFIILCGLLFRRSRLTQGQGSV